MSSLNIKNVIEQIDLVEYAERFTHLSLSGSQFRGVCPICNHGNDSEFVIYNHRSFYCFVCHAGGDVINLVQAVKQLDFFAAVETLAEELNIDIQKDEGYVRRKSLSLQFKSAVDKYRRRIGVVETYLKEKRGLTDKTISDFELGANEEGSVTIPYVDQNGRYVGLAVRRFEGNPKYVNSKNNELFSKAEFLYNLRGAKPKIKKALFLVEGYFCAMTLHQLGMPAVAYNGSTLSKQQCYVLQKLYESHPEMTVALIPDNDGVAYDLLTRTRRNVLSAAPNVPFIVLQLPEGIKDVNDLYTAGRIEEFKTLPAFGLDEFVLQNELNKCEYDVAERKIVESFIREVKDPVTIERIAELLSDRWGSKKEVVREFLKVSQNNQNLQEDFKTAQQCYEETRAMLLDKRLQYGITALDEGLRGGGRRKDVTFIGASAGAGKTFLSIQMAVDMVVRQLKNAIYFSMEMSAGALYERVLSNLLGKSTDEVDKLIQTDDRTVKTILDKLKERLYVVDKNGLTISQIDAYVKEANVKFFDGCLDVIFIDYIQYMKGCAEYQVLAETAKGMKPLAKDNNIHVIVLSQLNRGVRTWEKPDLGALKGGGDLEASADNVFLMWRPGSNPNLAPKEQEIIKNELRISVAKARNGSSVRELTLQIDPNTSRIRMK